jgi:lipopolysaccharide/colanic/teichoic acid biosynthesis glycosyltransferase
MKRSLDCTFATLALVLLSPVFLALALLIACDSPGPVFFRQTRVGRHGRLFRLWKWRTMHLDAGRRGPMLTEIDDPRITRIGRVLRRTKLDEMSLVGPRPELPQLVALYSPEEAQVLTVRPGVTGPTQLLYRNEEIHYPPGVDVVQYYVDHLMRPKLISDLAYVAQHSLWADLGILLQTFWALLPHASRQHAHRHATPH